MFELGKIVGLKVVALKGARYDAKQKRFETTYILFDDKKTYIMLDEQDAYAYHDCSYSARMIEVYQNKDTWKAVFEDDVNYPVANMDI